MAQGAVIERSSAGTFTPAWACEIDRQRNVAWLWRGRTPERMTTGRVRTIDRTYGGWRTTNMHYMRNPRRATVGRTAK